MREVAADAPTVPSAAYLVAFVNWNKDGEPLAMAATWETLGIAPGTAVSVYDLYTRETWSELVFDTISVRGVPAGGTTYLRLTPN